MTRNIAWNRAIMNFIIFKALEIMILLRTRIFEVPINSLKLPRQYHYGKSGYFHLCKAKFRKSDVPLTHLRPAIMLLLFMKTMLMMANSKVRSLMFLPKTWLFLASAPRNLQLSNYQYVYADNDDLLRVSTKWTHIIRAEIKKCLNFEI